MVQDRAKIAYQACTDYNGGSCVFYDSAYTLQLQREHELNALFGQSLANGDFKVYLQPKVRLEDGTIAGEEALVRWQHPQRGMILPAEFIPAFEKNGIITQIDLYVFEQVCKTLLQWRREGLSVVPVSVNLSRIHFQTPDFLYRFEEIARRYDIPKGLIEFELTESIFFDERGIEQVKEQLKRMHQMGFLCSLDDFGAGYSFLGLLMEFDIDTIKLDRQFFVDVSRPKTRDVIECIITLAKRLDAAVVAEGIENQEQLDFLKGLQCDIVQGYYFFKPMPIKEFRNRITHGDGTKG